jgi:Holliday junction DNA helicase RuvB
MDDRFSDLPTAPETRVGGDVRAIFWQDLVGQADLKRRLDVRIRAAVAAERPLDHLLLTAPPGYGKTTLANMVAIRLGRAFKPFVAPVAMEDIENALAEHSDEGLVIFIDEIHLATKREQENLLTLLEEGFIFTGGERRYHNNLTVIGGTTRRDRVIPALLDRFPIKPVFSEYDDAEMSQIVDGMAARLGITLPDGMAESLGLATGGTPRNGRGLVSAARDLGELGDYSVEDVIDLVGVSRDGLDEMQVRYLGLLADSESGKMGLNPLAARLQLSTTSVEALEQLPLRRGLVELAVGGREITTAGRARIAEFRATGK